MLEPIYTVCVLFSREMESEARENSLSEKSLNWSLVSGPLMKFLRVNLFSLRLCLAFFGGNGK